MAIIATIIKGVAMVIGCFACLLGVFVAAMYKGLDYIIDGASSVLDNDICKDD